MIPSVYHRLLLSELRLAAYVPGSRELTDADMTFAATLNENLISLGYTLTPNDLMRIAQSPSRDAFYQTLCDSMGDIQAEPMYPDFPEQVMEMDEAQFRFHQAMHYFSTYGLEKFFGARVLKGWLPEMPSTEKTVSDTRLLNAKVIEAVAEEDVCRVVFERVLSKKERMGDKERELIRFALDNEKAERLIDGVTVRFKENLMDIFYTIFSSEAAAEEKLRLLHAICQHTGDVFKCFDFVLTRCKYRLRTSQKRLIVKLLESYPAADLRANVILSQKKAERNLTLLSFMDYNVYSRSEEHKQTIADLRDGKLRSWQSRVEALLSDRDDSALDFIASHPGMMVRMCARLVRWCYDPEKIEEYLIANADKLSAETLITLLTKLGKMLNLKGNICTTFMRSPDAEELREQRAQFRRWNRSKAVFKPRKVEQTVVRDRDEVKIVFSIFEKVLFEKLKTLDTPLKDKCVRLALDEYALDSSVILFNDRSAEGGYMRSGIAYRIPENVKRLRLATYWNHPSRVDIDLHASAESTNGETIRIGWNSGYKNSGIVFSGDITHSDAAEYIDIDMSAPIAHVTANVHLFSGADTFKEIETCFVGMMAVDKTGQNVKLSNPANYFFSHFLTSKCDALHYGFVDVANRALVFYGAEDNDSDGDYYKPVDRVPSRFSMQRYLDMLFKAQNVHIAEAEEEASFTLVMGKPAGEKEISLIDSSFFLAE